MSANALICECGHWYHLHENGKCRTCGCARKPPAVDPARPEILVAMVQDLRAKNDRLESENNPMRGAIKLLQRVQFILGGHSGIIADCDEDALRENVERALALMRKELPPMIDAAREPPCL